jgi:hypothetical protein
MPMTMSQGTAISAMRRSTGIGPGSIDCGVREPKVL